MSRLGATAVEPRGKMPLEERAKIFIPFDPLKGFREALRERELEAQARYGRVGENVETPDPIRDDTRWQE